jgi:hypothetical protein
MMQELMYKAAGYQTFNEFYRYTPPLSHTHTHTMGYTTYYILYTIYYYTLMLYTTLYTLHYIF